MKVVILAGGLGSRLQEETSIKPKPMVEIGGRPILWHIMQLYAAHGFKEFIIALGYKGEIIKQYFLNYFYTNNSFSVCLDIGKVEVHPGQRDDWVVHLVETGLSTETGGRLKRLASFIGNETFMMTYGDGVSNINIRAIVDFHHEQKKLATITAVRPPARFGALEFDGDLVSKFLEKPQAGEGWINGGFSVFEPGVLDYISGDSAIFERDTLPQLAAAGELSAYQHGDFWQCMDTLRDVRRLQDLWESGHAPWKVWGK